MKSAFKTLLLAAAGAALLAAPCTADEIEYPPGYEGAAQKSWDKANEALSEAHSTAAMLEVLTECLEEVTGYLEMATADTEVALREKAPELLPVFREDQRAWKKFVDKFTEASAGNFGEGGSMYTVTAVDACIRMVMQRLAYLALICSQMEQEL